MQKKLQDCLILLCSKFVKQNKDIFDIVMYGSFVKGKIEPRDIDILIIFIQKTLDYRLEIAQKFKNLIKNHFKETDVKTINLRELFESNFLARRGILTEGFSLLRKSSFSGSFGFKGYALFYYNLKNMNHNEKTKFTYALIGRNGDGILKNVKAEILGRASFLVPTENEIIFEDFLKKWNIHFNKKLVLVEI